MNFDRLFKSKKPDEDKFKLSEESAAAVIQKILDKYNIDMEADFPSEEDRKDFNRFLGKIIKAARLGLLEVKDDDKGFKVIQHMQSGNKDADLVYREIDGQAKIASAGVAKGDNYGRIYSIMGSLSGVGSAGIEKLKGFDLSVCEALFNVFLWL